MQKQEFNELRQVLMKMKKRQEPKESKEEAPDPHQDFQAWLEYKRHQKKK